MILPGCADSRVASSVRPIFRAASCISLSTLLSGAVPLPDAELGKDDDRPAAAAAGHPAADPVTQERHGRVTADLGGV
jgi:hypothetical protein